MHITGLILAGGRSRRMDSRDKGLIPLNGKAMIEHVIDKLKPQVDSIIISANQHRDNYRKTGYKVYADTYDDYRGPLAGICQGLIHINSHYLLTVPCDGPLLPTDLAVRLSCAAQLHQARAVMVFDGQYNQPTYNLIHRDLITSIQRALVNNEHKLGKWLIDNGALRVDFFDQKDAFTNVNTPQDLETLTSLLV
jgi:molybdopterin-guanine dinucleotide biosynthesis protein A